MYSIRHLLNLIAEAFSDMVPALEQAFNRNHDDDRLDEVFGPNPPLAIAGLILGGLALGGIVEWVFSDWGVWRVLDASALILAAVYAFLFRRYLFGAREPGAEDFPWLAATLIPAAALLVATSLVSRLADGAVTVLPGAPSWTLLGSFLVAAADALAMAAGLTIAVAALCYAQRWRQALKELLRQFITFKVIVWVMVLLMVEIGILGPLVSWVVGSLFGIRFPPWLGDALDQFTYALLMGTVYCAVIGATWLACRDRFAELIETGEANVLGAVRELAHPKKKGASVSAPEVVEQGSKGSK
ncbi:hypothetical protein [Wenzhouxiangella marina]|nr:hypothetical protein [Wenzhouxiangella marina]MBB6087050.1 MFS family permease [Wenzhouxiangella marina]